MKSSSQSKSPWALIGPPVAIFICLFGHLGAFGLVGPDEPRYVWIARAMAQTGDWVTPRLYGQPWFEKPILYYWAAAIGFKLGLPSEWAARLPSAIAALAAVVAIFLVARNHYGYGAKSLTSAPMLSALVFATSVGAIAFARAATPDMLFASTITLAMACVDHLFFSPIAHKRALSILAAFGFFLGLAVLAKGPAAILLCGGAIGVWALASGRWKETFQLFHPLAIGVFCVIALPWYVICARRNPDFLHVFIFQHNFERYLTPVFQHRQPFWFFGPITLLAILPWTVLLWPAAEDGLRLWREKSWQKSGGLFFFCWAAFPILFFSASQSKLPSYILPSVPPLSLILGITLARVMTADSPLHKRFSAVASLLGGTWIVLAIAAIISIRRLPVSIREQISHPVNFILIVAVVGGLASCLLGVKRKSAAVCTAIVLTALLTEIANERILPAIDPLISARPHAALLARDLHPDRIYTLGLARSWNYGLAFYFGRELPEWSPDDSNAALILTNPEGLFKLQKEDRFRGELDEEYRGILFVPVLPHAR